MRNNHRSELTKVTIHRSLTRQMMFLGGERTIVICSMFFCTYMTYLLSYRFGVFYSAFVGGGLWTLIIFLVRLMAKADEQMWAVVKRHLKYKAFYPARGRFDAFTPVIRDFK